MSICPQLKLAGRQTAEDRLGYQNSSQEAPCPAKRNWQSGNIFFCKQGVGLLSQGWIENLDLYRLPNWLDYRLFLKDIRQNDLNLEILQLGFQTVKRLVARILNDYQRAEGNDKEAERAREVNNGFVILEDSALRLIVQEVRALHGETSAGVCRKPVQDSGPRFFFPPLKWSPARLRQWIQPTPNYFLSVEATSKWIYSQQDLGEGRSWPLR